MHILCYIPDGKILPHLGFQSNVLPRPLTDLNARVGFCTSSPQQGVKFQLRYKPKLGRGIFINVPYKIPDGKVLAHLGFESNVSPGL
jgi:hypothetical protein